MALKLLTYPDNPRVGKALIAAKYAGVEIEMPPFKFGDDGYNKSEDYIRNAHPLGKVPVLQTQDGYIFESNAIARYIARCGDAKGAYLFGRTNFESAQVDMWIEYANNEIDPSAYVWVGPHLGYMASNAQFTEKAIDNIRKAFAGLDQWLETRTYLVGERLTLADITVVCSILPLYQLVMGVEERRPYTNLNRWFDTCINQKHFQDVLRPGALCGCEPAAADKKAKEEKPKAKEEKPKAKEGGAKKEEKKKEEKPKKEGKKEEKKEEKKKEEKPKEEKKKEEKPKDGAVDQKKMKAIIKEGGKKAQDLAGMADMGSLFQQAMLTEPEGDLEMVRVAFDAMNKEVDAEAEDRKGGAGEVAKILISSDKDSTKLCVLVHVPELYQKAESNVRQYAISAVEWAKAATASLPGDGKGVDYVEQTATLTSFTYTNNPEEGRFVLKAKDAISGGSFSFLRANSLVVADDDDSDDMIFGDDDMPGC